MKTKNIKVKLSRLLNNQTANSLKVLLKSQELPMAAWYKISKIVDLIKSESAGFNNIRKDLLDEHYIVNESKDKNTTPMFQPKNEESKNVFDKKINELLDVEVDVEAICLSEVGNLTLNGETSLHLFGVVIIED